MTATTFVSLNYIGTVETVKGGKIHRIISKATGKVVFEIFFKDTVKQLTLS